MPRPAQSRSSGSREIVLVKLGGSLITDKRRPDTARPEVIRRLAAEVARARRATSADLILGHGSGSFGHVAAARAGFGGNAGGSGRLAGVSRTQAKAAELHRLVAAVLAEAGADPFSIAPSSAVVARGGEPCCLLLRPLLAALELGLLPVVYGDVVMDSREGAAIASTEAVLSLVARRLARRGFTLRRAFWLGETDGVYGAGGETLPAISAGRLEAVRGLLAGAAGTDVTGGMSHRVETAVALTRLGITSWIVDGRVPGLLERALAGEEVGGTRIEAARG